MERLYVFCDLNIQWGHGIYNTAYSNLCTITFLQSHLLILMEFFLYFFIVFVELYHSLSSLIYRFNYYDDLFLCVFLCLQNKKMACPAGLEPATYCLEGNCSIQLSHGHTRIHYKHNFIKNKTL